MAGKSMITAVKELRSRTLAGYVDCRRALTDAGGNLEEAEKLVRQRGLAEVERKTDRETKVGLVHSYVHTGGRIGAMVEVSCETDFVARTDEFKEFVHDMAMQVAASRPKWISVNDIPLEDVADGSGREAFCLLSQDFVKDRTKSVQEVLDELVVKVDEKIKIQRIQRWEAGEPEPKLVVPELQYESPMKGWALAVLAALVFFVGVLVASL